VLWVWPIKAMLGVRPGSRGLITSQSDWSRRFYGFPLDSTLAPGHKWPIGAAPPSASVLFSRYRSSPNE